MRHGRLLLKAWQDSNEFSLIKTIFDIFIVFSCHTLILICTKQCKTRFKRWTHSVTFIRWVHQQLIMVFLKFRVMPWYWKDCLTSKCMRLGLYIISFLLYLQRKKYFELNVNWRFQLKKHNKACQWRIRICKLHLSSMDCNAVCSDHKSKKGSLHFLLVSQYI